jgi:ABC-type lipoprotein export system ATPase subunit/GNAT superfamily N-acetyltransferase
LVRRKEEFEITSYARRYDREEGKFVVDIAYSTAAKVTPRTVAVAEAFGLGVDQEQKFTIYDNVELKIGTKDVVLITGESGSGKSILLKTLAKDIRDNRTELGDVINISDVVVEEDKPLIETVGKTVEEGLELLSRVGLNDAFLFLRTYEQLSDGQRYRYRIAKMIESGAQWWVMDEFCATLDRDTAKIVAFNVQKLARDHGKAVLAATTHNDLLEDLAPSVHINKRYGKEITVDYNPNALRKECSLTTEMVIVKAKLKDYEELSGFHYRDSGGIPAAQKVFILKHGEQTVGAIVYRSPGLVALGRLLSVGRKVLLQELNRDWSLITRVVVHPKYRTIGLGAKLVRDTLEKCGRPYVESIAVMARFNPFFERAGMRKVAVSQPDKRLLKSLTKLEELGFDTVYLSSYAYNLTKLNKDPQLIEKVKDVLSEFGRNNGIYRKRLCSVRKAFMTKEEYYAVVDNADTDKLSKMLRILSILAQPKAYLFWKNENALGFLRDLEEDQPTCEQLG